MVVSSAYIYTDPEGKEEGKSFVNDDANCVGAKIDRHRCRYRYDFTLFSTLTQRFFQFYRLILGSAFSLIRGKKIANFQLKVEHDRNGNRLFRVSRGFNDDISFNMCLSFSHFAHPAGINKINEPCHNPTLLLLLVKKVMSKL